MEDALLDEMFRLEQTHWWFSAKREIVLALLNRWVPCADSAKGTKRIYDIGCGCGALLVQLREKGYNAIGMDSNDLSLRYCEKRKVPVQKGCLPDKIPPAFKNADAVLLLDVLEHIEEDQKALFEAARITAQGGLLILTVPAYPWLWTERDKHHRHYRRYTKSGLTQMIRSVPAWSPLFVGYINFFLFPVALVDRCFRKFFRSNTGKTDLKLPPMPFNNLLKGIYAAEKHVLLRSITFPYGLSIIALLKKKEGGSSEQ